MTTEPPAGTLIGAWIQAPCTNEADRFAAIGPLPSSTVIFSARLPPYASQSRAYMWRVPL